MKLKRVMGIRIPALVAVLAFGCASVADGGSEEPTTWSRPGAEAGPVEPWAQSIVDAADRDDDDRETDGRRHPAETLTFIGIEPGMRIVDLGAGNGYTTELLARAVGTDGVVFAHNEPAMLDQFFTAWSERLERDAMRSVVRVDRDYRDPLPAEARDLDLATILFSYHDIIAFGSDPRALNDAVFDALRPGGIYVVIDHSAVPGSGTRTTKSLHRIDERLVREQVEAAGFELIEEAQFLRNPEDDRSWKVWTRGFTNDRFVLKFRKPGGAS